MYSEVVFMTLTAFFIFTYIAHTHTHTCAFMSGACGGQGRVLDYSSTRVIAACEQHNVGSEIQNQEQQAILTA